MKPNLILYCITFIFLFIAGCGKTNKAVNSQQAPEERKRLHSKFAELDIVLKNKAPYIYQKLAPPAEPNDIEKLRKNLGNVKIDCLEMWYEWHNGCTDNLTDILPIGRILSINESVRDRALIQKIPFVQIKRKNAIKIIEDGAGDGFFLDITSSKPRVFYHMLEDDTFHDFGTLEEFTGFIISVHESGNSSLGKKGMIDFDLKKYQKIESGYLKTLSSF